MTDNDTSPKASTGGDTPYVVIVGILAGLIVVSLATLWLIERNRRVEAQRRLAEVAAQPGAQHKAQLARVLQAWLARQRRTEAPDGCVRPVQVADIVQMHIEGDTRRLTLSADAGRRLGLSPGDVLHVSEAPTTRPGGQRSGQTGDGPGR